MCDAVEHPSDGEEPGGEERGCSSRSQSWDRSDPNPEPRQVEDDEDRERHAWQTEECWKPLMKAGSCLLGEVDALESDREGEGMGGGMSPRQFVGRWRTTQREEQGSKSRQTQNDNAREQAQHGATSVSGGLSRGGWGVGVPGTSVSGSAAPISRDVNLG